MSVLSVFCKNDKVSTCSVILDLAENEVPILCVFCKNDKVSSRSMIVMKPRAEFLSLEYFCCGFVMLKVAEVLHLALRSLISFHSAPNVLLHEV